MSITMQTANNKLFWTEFITMYKNLPCLWNFVHADYTNREVKGHAYKLLLRKMQELYPEGVSLPVLKKKINILRTNYFRDLKKIARPVDPKTGMRYKPKLWYFELLSFLGEQEEELEEDMAILAEICDEPPGPRSAKKIKREQQKQQDREEEIRMKQLKQERLIQQQQQRISQLVQNRQTLSQQKGIVKPKPALDMAASSSSLTDDALTISQTWGILFRDLDARQKLFANKTITEVLYQGALGKLHEYSYKAIENGTSASKYENPLEITIDRLNYADQDMPMRHLANINEALNYLKPLEEYAVRENHAAMSLISQLEETLRNMTEDPDYYNYND